MREMEFNIKVTCKYDKCKFYGGAGVDCKSCSEVVIFEVYYNGELVKRHRNLVVENEVFIVIM